MPPGPAHRLKSYLMATAVLFAASPGLAQSLPHSCWSEQELKAKPGESRAHKGDRRFDRAPDEPPLPQSAPPAWPGVVRRVELSAGRKLIALTFDLCEQPGEVAGYDGAIVDYLRKERIKATFFAGGKWLRSHAERAGQLISDPLFEIGNHSEAHRNLRRLSGARLLDEIIGPQRAYAAIRAELAAKQCIGSSVAPVPLYFRFPFGACNAAALKAVNEQGLTVIQWDFSTGDPAPEQSAAAIARAMLSHARPGAIILAHANGRGWHTAAALPLALPRLRAQGYEFVTVSELLAAGQPLVEDRCYDARPGDTDRFDGLVSHRPRPPRPPDEGWSFKIFP